MQSTTEEDFELLLKALKNNDIDNLKTILENFDVTAANKNSCTCLVVACGLASSPEAMNLVFDKVTEVGDRELLQNQLTTVNNTGANCLMLASHYSSSPSVINLVFDKVSELGGRELLKSQLVAVNDKGANCLMLAVRNPSSAEVVKIVFEKITHLGGRQLLQSQLVALNKNGSNVLMLACCNSNAEVVKLVIQNMAEVAGETLLQSQLNAANNDGDNCLVRACRDSTPEVILLVASLSFHLSPADFSQQYQRASRVSSLKKMLQEKVSIRNTSWIPPDECVKELKNLLGLALEKRNATAQKTQEDFEALLEALKTNSTENLKKVLENFDVMATNAHGCTCVVVACGLASSPEAMNLVFEKVIAAGGSQLLQNQLVAVNSDGANCLMLASHYSPSPAVMNLVFDKVSELGGRELLKTQFTAITSSGLNFLMVASCNSSSVEVVKLVFEKITDLGGPELLHRQLTSTRNDGTNCLMRGCMQTSSPEVMSLLFQKVIDAGGSELLQSQLKAVDSTGRNCVMLAVRNTASLEVVKLLFEKTSEVGGPQLLQNQLVAVDNDGANCAMLAVLNTSSPEIVSLLFEKIVGDSSPQLLKSQLAAVNKNGSNVLMLACCYSNAEVVKLVIRNMAEVGGETLLQSQLNTTNKSEWNALMFACRASTAEVILLVASLSFHLSPADFSEQYQRASHESNLKKALQEKVAIDDASWNPPDECVTELKNLLGPALEKHTMTTKKTQEDFEALRDSLTNNDMENLKKLLQNFDLTSTDKNGSTGLVVACTLAASPDAVHVVFERVLATGGPQLLQNQLVAVNNDGANCLMRACYNSSSPEVVKLLFEKISQVGGPQLLKSQITAANNAGWNCAILAARNTASPEVAEIVFDKISQVGGPQLLKRQITATNSDVMNLLMAACCNSSSPEVVKLVCKKIVEVSGGDARLLQSQLNATDKSGWNALMFACRDSSPEVILLVASLSCYLSATDFAQQYQRASSVASLKNTLQEKVAIDNASWTPPDECVNELKNLLGPALEQYAAQIAVRTEQAPTETAHLQVYQPEPDAAAPSYYNCDSDRDSGFMACFALIILILQGVAWSQPLYSVYDGPQCIGSQCEGTLARYYFFQACIYTHNGYANDGQLLVCVSYPGNVGCIAQQSNGAVNLGAIITSNIFCFLALVSSCCCTSRITHGVLFLSSLICSIVNVAVTATLSQKSSCPATQFTVTTDTDVGFTLLIGILILHFLALIRVGFNKALLKWCHRVYTCTDLVAVASSSSSAPANEMEYNNYGTSSSVNVINRGSSSQSRYASVTNDNSLHQCTPMNNNNNHTTAPTPTPPPPTIPDWMASLPVDDDMKALLVKERINESNFLLLEENDLKELGVPLGPRKQLAQEIRRRQTSSD